MAIKTILNPTVFIYFLCGPGFFFSQFATNSATLNAQVLISEYAPSNKGEVTDSFGETSDWIELWNSGTTAVSLGGYALSDDSLKTHKWEFPAISLNPDARLLVFASGRNLSGSELHTSFKISKGSEGVWLFNHGQLVAQLYSPCVPEATSYGIIRVNPQTVTAVMPAPTPGAINDTTGYWIPDLTPVQLSVSHPGGFYDSSFELKISANGDIRYTFNGNEPEDDDYNTPSIWLNEEVLSGDINDIPTSPEWEKPSGDVFRAIPLRATGWRRGCPVGEPVNTTYIIGKKYSFPVVSLLTDKDNLFDEEEGIYVEGTGEEPNYVHKGDDWERAAWMEYFVDENAVISQQTGIRIHGRDSRNRPQKSLRIYADDKYGKDSLHYPFFNTKPIDSYKRLIVRTSWNHRTNALFKDEMIHYLMRDLNLGTQAFQPVILLINGEYWGIHNLRERQDKHYISGNYGADPEQLDFLGISLDGDEETEGDWQSFEQLRHYVESNDLSQQQHFDWVEKEVDLENYINHYIAYMYTGNYDWPRNNVRFWKERKAGAKWRWMFFDCDVCFGNSTQDHLTSLINGSEKFDEYHWLMQSLLKNEKFRQRFLNTFMHHIQTTFHPDTVVPVIDHFAKRYLPEVPEHIARWHFPENLESWEENVERLKSFAIQRPVEMVRKLNELMGGLLQVYPNPANDHISINTDGVFYERFEVIDLSGRTVISAGPYITGMDVRELSPGYYFLIAEGADYRFSVPFVVAR